MGGGGGGVGTRPRYLGGEGDMAKEAEYASLPVCQWGLFTYLPHLLNWD